MSNRNIHLCTRVVLRYIGTLRFTTYTLFSQSNLRLKLEQIYCMASFWCCHQNNTVTRVSKCKLKLLLFVIMILNNFQCFVRKVFFYIDHDTSFHEKRKTHFWFYFLQRKIWIIIFSLKQFYKACTKLTPLILGLFSTIFQICMKNIKISTHVSRCNRIIYQMPAYLFLFSLAIAFMI